jgi:hypothetical protein
VWHHVGVSTTRVLLRVYAIAIGVCVLVVVATLATGEPLPGVVYLLIPGVAVGVAGGIVFMRLFAADGKEHPGHRNPVRRLGRFWRLTGRAGLLAQAGLAAVAIASIAISTGPLQRGTPRVGAGDCPYVMHLYSKYSGDSVDTCVTRVEWDRARAAQQQLGVGIFLWFLAVLVPATFAQRTRERLTAPPSPSNRSVAPPPPSP